MKQPAGLIATSLASPGCSACCHLSLKSDLEQGSPASASEALESQVQATVPSSYSFVLFQGLNPGPHSLKTNALLTEPAPQSQLLLLLLLLLCLESLRTVTANIVPCSCCTIAASLSSVFPQQATPRTLPQAAGSPHPFDTVLDGSFTPTLSYLAAGRSHRPLT